MCFVLFFSNMCLNSALTDGKKQAVDFKDTPGENKSSFHSVKVNVELEYYWLL